MGNRQSMPRRVQDHNEAYRRGGWMGDGRSDIGIGSRMGDNRITRTNSSIGSGGRTSSMDGRIPYGSVQEDVEDAEGYGRRSSYAPSTLMPNVGGGPMRVWSPNMTNGEVVTIIYVINCGESNGIHPEFVTGRMPSSVLTSEGMRQTRALGLSFLSSSTRFHSFFTSPLERSKQTALQVLQELNINQERLEHADSLIEMSYGLWEGLQKQEIYTKEMMNVISNLNIDFRAPGGESQRQVEFRMVEFLNNVVLERSTELNIQKDPKLYYHKSGGSSIESKTHDPQTNLAIKGKGRSQIHMAPPSIDTSMGMTLGEHAFDQNMSLSMQAKSAHHYAAIFSHEMAIKCLLRGILGTSHNMVDHILIDNCSVTILRHSTYYGWRVLRMNDTSHLK